MKVKKFNELINEVSENTRTSEAGTVSALLLIAKILFEAFNETEKM